DEENDKKYYITKRNEKLSIYDDKFENGALTVLSPRPVAIQAGLLVLPPGVSRLYARRGKKLAIANSVLSTGALIGILISNGRREKAVNVSKDSYHYYNSESKRSEVNALYKQYAEDRREAKIWRNREIGFGAMYAILFAYEAYSAIRDGLTYRAMIKDFRELEKTLFTSEISSF
ncbi:hypothetical protein ACFL6S_37575, partial [Candidatus Poribacteria bacterium]